MHPTYSVAITGIKEGVSKEEAVKRFAALFKLPESKAAVILQSAKFRVKCGVDLKTSVKYEEALGQCGLTCVVEPDSEQVELATQAAAPSTQDASTQPDEPAPPAAGDSAARSPLAPKWIWVAIASAVAGVAAIVFINSGIIPEAPIAESKFDVAARVGKSTQADIEVFKNAGGIENKDEAIWRGYQATSFRAVYDERTGLLGMITVGLLNGESGGYKAADLESVKKSLSEDCGEHWTSNLAQTASSIHVASKGLKTCSVEIRDSEIDGVIVTLAVDTDALHTPQRIAEPPLDGASDPSEQQIADCVDRKINELHGTYGIKGDSVSATVLEELEGKCRSELQGRS